MKLCPKCKIEKPFTEFANDLKNKDKLRSNCYKCSSEYFKQWKVKNPNGYLETQYKYSNSEKGFLSRSISILFTSSRIKERGYRPESNKKEIKNHFYEYVNKYGRICYYCLEPWTYIKRKYEVGNKTSKGKTFLRHPKNFSIDRLDNNITYKVDNIIFCCSECNASKKDISIKLIKRLNEIIKEKNL